MTRKSNKPPLKPPGHLSSEARRLWTTLHRAYVIDLPASILLLTTLCEAWDAARRCRKALRGQPLTIMDKHGGVRVHPLVVEERQRQDQVARMARMLRIHLEQGQDDASTTALD